MINKVESEINMRVGLPKKESNVEHVRDETGDITDNIQQEN